VNQLISWSVFIEDETSEKTTADRADFDNGKTTMRRLENYVKKYGPEFGPKLFHALQSQAAHTGVSARLRKKIDVLTGKASAVPKPEDATLPLFPESVLDASESTLSVAISA
jgi:hypothetical protein